MGGIGGLDGLDESGVDMPGGMSIGMDARGMEERRKAVWMRKQWREAEVAGEVKKPGALGAGKDGPSTNAGGDVSETAHGSHRFSGSEKDGWLDFAGVSTVCKRLNIASSRQDLLDRFKVRSGSLALYLHNHVPVFFFVSSFCCLMSQFSPRLFRSFGVFEKKNPLLGLRHE